jgi:hypothetical protein
VISEPVDWTPLKNMNTKFTKFDIFKPTEEDMWQFVSFLANARDRMYLYESNAAKQSEAAKITA